MPMEQNIAVKWSLKDTYRAKLAIDDLFDPTTNYSPVHGEIYAKLQAATSLTSGSATWEPVSGAVTIEIRTPGSKVYERLDKHHRDGTVNAGRARLRVVAGQDLNSAATPTLKRSTTSTHSPVTSDSTHCPDLLKVFLEAGSSSEPVAIKPALKQPALFVKEKEEGANGIATAQTTPANAWKSFSTRLNEPFTRPLTDNLTRADVDQMIEAKLSEFSRNLFDATVCSDVAGATATAARAGPAENTEKKASHRHNAICDSCDSYIVGVRWKCLGCPDFDACEDCRESAQKEHSTHRFVKIMDDAIVRAVSHHNMEVHAGILCDGPQCTNRKTSISGDRYKCSICADYDLCAACEVHPENKHNPSHPMIKLKKPSRLTVAVENEDMSVTKDIKRTEAHASPVVDFKFEDLQRRVVTPTEEFRDAFANIGAKVRQAITQKGNSLRVVKHLTVACDSCNQMIRGSRFMCATCVDFDLCQACYEQSLHDRSHVFVRYNHFVNNIVTPRLKIDAVSVDSVQKAGKSAFNYSCDECNTKPQTGKRYNCLVCEDYDACEGCKDVHLNSHPMQIIPLFQAQRSRKLSLRTDENVAEQKSTSEDDAITVPHKSGDITVEDLDIPERLSADFVEDISIPDSTTIDAGAQFVKQWLVKNDGNVPWPVGVKAACVGGLKLTAVSAFNGKEILTETETMVHPGQSAVISAFLQAPKESQDNVVSYFRLFTPDDACFGCSLWVDVDVKSATVARSVDNVVAEVDDENNAIPGTESVRSHVDEVSTTTTESTMIFPSASMELAKAPLSSIDSHSIAGTQRGETWESESEVVLSDDDDDYDVLDNESFVGDE
ncbi:ZZ type zinc finger domain protein [Taphrina deformans PYCC 5710]|uniref:ZZ type zinc finger domain protein n=1 Tax=Taphrina deformans (strain PYCC 5710 / ATCC 11124 / CBS 356.35 / IMI 108563 / JCM 9778 / NBRC 8474) TaxID=1097556 RepID=R4X992_TAPDE|nr:ZZ type zinc finger domain protein [Taphrina deformans PYCC 5710]|eukprot:CCG81990.1 ZZ type zinc finger domain protein [Taphrina deformans PYCC 5710]